MKQFEPQAAAAVVGLAAYELIRTWNDMAPSLTDVRKADKSDNLTRQQLLDADVVVGILALTIGAAFAVLAKDYSVLIILIVVYGTLSLLHHYLLNAESVVH